MLMENVITKNNIAIEYPAIVSNINNRLVKDYSFAKVYGEKIYSPFYGVCIDITRYENDYSVVIQYDVDTSIRFTHIGNIQLRRGQLVNKDDYVGDCLKGLDSNQVKSFVKVYKLCSYGAENSTSMYINLALMYTHDPRELINGIELFKEPLTIQESYYLETNPSPYILAEI